MTVCRRLSPELEGEPVCFLSVPDEQLNRLFCRRTATTRRHNKNQNKTACVVHRPFAKNSVVAFSLLPNNLLLGPMSTGAGCCGKSSPLLRPPSPGKKGIAASVNMKGISLFIGDVQNIVEPTLQQISLLGLHISRWVADGYPNRFLTVRPEADEGQPMVEFERAV